MRENEILDEDKNWELKKPIPNWWLNLFLLIIFEIFTFILVIVLDPFHIGVKYMGEGLPMMFGLLFSWIATFKIWALYIVVFILSPQTNGTAHTENDLMSFLLLELIVNSVYLYFDPLQIISSFGNGNGAMAFLLSSMIVETLVFYGWVWYKFSGYKKTYKDFIPSEKIRFLILLELVLLTAGILLRSAEGLDMIFTLELFGTSILALFWLITPPYIFKEKSKNKKQNQ